VSCRPQRLEARGFDRQQSYALCGVAVDLRISQVVDVPNLLVSALHPLLLPFGSRRDLFDEIPGGDVMLRRTRSLYTLPL
jgi:hypothetical protein